MALTRRMVRAVEMAAGGMTQAEAGARCGISQAAFAMRLSRARRRLRAEGGRDEPGRRQGGIRLRVASLSGLDNV